MSIDKTLASPDEAFQAGAVQEDPSTTKLVLLLDSRCQSIIRFRILDLLPLLVTNVDADAVDFLQGHFLGFSSSLASCASAKEAGLSDVGTAFEKDERDDSFSSITIPADALCESRGLSIFTTD